MYKEWEQLVEIHSQSKQEVSESNEKGRIEGYVLSYNNSEVEFDSKASKEAARTPQLGTIDKTNTHSRESLHSGIPRELDERKGSTRSKNLPVLFDNSNSVDLTPLLHETQTFQNQAQREETMERKYKLTYFKHNSPYNMYQKPPLQKDNFNYKTNQFSIKREKQEQEPELELATKKKVEEKNNRILSKNPLF